MMMTCQSGNSTIHRAALAGSLLAVWIVCHLAPASTDAGEEFDVHGARMEMLSNLPEFIDWPGSAEPLSDAFNLCLMVEEAADQALEFFERQTVKGLPIDAQRLSAESDGKGCQLLFVSHALEESLTADVERLSANGILAVGETEAFLAEGGVLSLIVDAGHVVVVANVEAAARYGFTLDSSLLAMARLHEGAQP